MGINPDPPVDRIFLFGPVRDGRKLAGQLYPFCRESRWIPAFFAEESLTQKVEKRFYEPLTRTGVITFGSDSAQVYERLRGRGKWLKILRLLEPGAVPPKPFFSYEEQIFPWPEGAEAYQQIISWMGIVPFGDWTGYEATYPGALSPEELGKNEQTDWLQEKEVYT